MIALVLIVMLAFVGLAMAEDPRIQREWMVLHLVRQARRSGCRRHI